MSPPKTPLTGQTDTVVSVGGMAKRFPAHATNHGDDIEFDLVRLREDFVLLCKMSGMPKVVFLVELAAQWDSLIIDSIGRPN